MTLAPEATASSSHWKNSARACGIYVDDVVEAGER